MDSAIQITGTNQLEAWRSDRIPDVERVAPDLWSVPVPIPRGTLRYTNVYVLESADGLTLIDTGWDTTSALTALTEGLLETGHDIGDVRRILVTHVHRDHYGQAGVVQRASGALIGMHPHEASCLPRHLAARDIRMQRFHDWLHKSGVDPKEWPSMIPPSLSLEEPMSLPEPDFLIDDGQVLTFQGWSLRALWTPGHTPGHLCFIDEKNSRLLSGDHLLPRITPNVSDTPERSDRPLEAFLQSLSILDTLELKDVLPAHEYRFRGIKARTQTLRKHHHARLEEIRSLVDDSSGTTAWNICARATWSKDWESTAPMLRRLALGEVLAHLQLLHRQHLISLENVDGHEIWRPNLPSTGARTTRGGSLSR